MLRRSPHKISRFAVSETMTDTPNDSAGWQKTAPVLRYADQYDAAAPDADYPADGSDV
ncbi:hypothetical protein D3C78_1752890 [compost metagenome]